MRIESSKMILVPGWSGWDRTLLAGETSEFSICEFGLELGAESKIGFAWLGKKTVEVTVEGVWRS